jgi:hypothetical protein
MRDRGSGRIEQAVGVEAPSSSHEARRTAAKAPAKLPAGKKLVSSRDLTNL